MLGLEPEPLLPEDEGDVEVGLGIEDVAVAFVPFRRIAFRCVTYIYVSTLHRVVEVTTKVPTEKPRSVSVLLSFMLMPPTPPSPHVLFS